MAYDARIFFLKDESFRREYAVAIDDFLGRYLGRAASWRVRFQQGVIMTGRFSKGAGVASHAAMSLVQLFDRRTGSVHRVDGRPVAVWVSPSGVEEAVARLISGRDPGVWGVRVLEMTSPGGSR